MAIVVDVTHATDYPGIEKRRHGDYRLGGGPVLSRGASVSEVVFERLAAAAEAEGIPYTIEAASRDTHTDAEAIFNAHRAWRRRWCRCRTATCTAPTRWSRSRTWTGPPGCSPAFVRRLTPDTDFVPR